VLGLISAAAGVFDRRLNPASAAPIAVAFSGGGDSLAALLATKAWADVHGRRVLALSVDHRLQAQSGAWIAFAEAVARRIGADFQALAWDGPKPPTGLPAAARAARHRLVADAARAAQARVVVFGHTADDVFEGEVMRGEGLRLGGLREWSPAPVWPEGRGLFLVRPLLAVRRAAIRQGLRDAEEPWIDDPANEDPRSPRARARSRLAGSGEGSRPSPDDAGLSALARSASASPDGALHIPRRILAEAPAPTARRMLAAGVLCVGGQERPPRGDRLDSLFSRAAGPEPFQATLAGCKIIADEDLLLARDAGEARRGGLAPLKLRLGMAVVWDGRFELVAREPGLSVRAMAGAASLLTPPLHKALRTVASAARPALPLVRSEHGPLACPTLICTPAVRARSLVEDRFLAACGAISQEPAT
jgi:tRNA(Ile)-lysidine synthase